METQEHAQPIAAVTSGQLDTSGVVWMPKPTPNTMMPGRMEWEHLDAFTQGYVEAMWLAAYHDGQFATAMKAGRRDMRLPGFSDLAPETLAAILKDCERGESYAIHPFGRLYNSNASGGACLWSDRQAGHLGPAFPPLTVTLGHDGKVYLRGAKAEGRS